mgnify:CR=1 FL=1
MNTKQIGDSYEVFVHQVYQLLQKADNEDGIKNITIEKNKIITDRNGRKRQFDIFWEYTILGEKYTTAVECKNYTSRVSISNVEAFVTKINSLNISKGIMVSRHGFQAGAEAVATEHGISLVSIREPVDDDWKGRFRGIYIKYTVFTPCQIICDTLKLYIDKEWECKNSFAKDKFEINDLSNKIFITNYDGKDRVSLHDIESKLPTGNGRIEHFSKEFTDSYFECKDSKIKISKIEFDYNSYAPYEFENSIDFTPLLKAVVEYINEEKKKLAVFIDGTKKEY